MNLLKDKATYIKDEFNVYIGDIVDNEKIKISERFVIVGNMKTSDLICTKDLIVIGNIEAESIFINGNLTCLGNIEAADKCIFGKLNKVFNEFCLIEKTQENLEKIEETKDIETKKIDQEIIDKNKSSDEELVKEVKIYEDLYSSIEKELFLLNFKSSNKLYYENKSIFFESKYFKEIHIDPIDKVVTYIKFNNFLYLRVSEILDVLKTPYYKVKSEEYDILKLGYIGQNKNGINFCRVDDVYRMFIKLLDIKKENNESELDIDIEKNIKILFDKISIIQKNIGTLENTIPYWSKKISILLERYGENELKDMIELSDLEIKQLKLGYVIDLNKRNELEEIYSNLGNSKENNIFNLIDKKGDIISGKIVNIDTDKIKVRTDLNVCASLILEEGSNRTFTKKEKIFAYIKDVIFVDNEIRLVLKDNDKYFVLKLIEYVLEKLNYNKVYFDVITQIGNLFIVPIRSGDLDDDKITCINEQISSIIKGIKVILKLKK